MLREEQRAQEQFDKESNFGWDTTVQQTWEAKVKSILQKTAQYSSKTFSFILN
ncbi:MAG: hypothetical protein JWN76_1916 [Chitinophagaceae bacterium]|nr:hypothetical protein [Chitinophagaceae bacterium]